MYVIRAFFYQFSRSLWWGGRLFGLVTCLILVSHANTSIAQGSRPSIEVQPLQEPDTEQPKTVEPIIRGNGQGLGDRAPKLGPLAADKVAILQALDKVTARVSKIEAEIGRPIRFGTLDIIAHSCQKRPPEEPPETTAFLEITEFRPDGEPATLFVGWMFASSPALSALEHPVYDVWVFDCRDKS